MIVLQAGICVAEDVTVPPAYFDPDRECSGEECDQRKQPALHCEGQNCLPPQDNPVVKCEGQDCLPPAENRVEQCEGVGCVPSEESR